MSDKVIIFDTTLRDGEQCPGASMNLREKMEVARQLARLNIDVIEAGFPVISDGDFEAVSKIATEIKGPVICGLARCIAKDIDAAGAAIKAAGERGRIHTFISTSKIQVENQLKKQVDDVIPIAVECVRRARTFVKDVEFSPMDATRTDPEFLVRLLNAVIEAGATTLNIPDTVGYTVPEQYAELIGYLRANVRNADDVIFSVHCHNDLGLATANSLAAVRAGARQVEGTINGIGERAGNAALEEVVMALKMRNDYYGGVTTGINTKEIVKASRLVSRMSGLMVQRSKAIVGENAFAHGSGIHQDGILKKRETYEIIDPRDVGWGETELPLTKHSGRHAVAKRLEHLGYFLNEKELGSVFVRFKEIGDKKKFVYDDDLSVLVDDSIDAHLEGYTLDYIHVASGSSTIPTATVRLKRGEEILQDSSPGNGAVDAAMKTIDRILNQQGHLVEYNVQAVTQGKDALGEVTLKCDFGGGPLVTGKGASTDVIEASARAYLNAVNRVLSNKTQGQAAPASDAP
ncbi:MAG: 2-isopropylmalate synthase [Chthoniobacteraceae bacterium]|nr:2-isopropylmalate synthase [Chthoniobacteraceae bacterium]